MDRRDFLKTTFSLAAAGMLGAVGSQQVPARPARRRQLRLKLYAPKDGRMAPTHEKSLGRIFFMDRDYNPIMVPIKFGDSSGEIIAQEPDRPFQINCAEWVEGFGYNWMPAHGETGIYNPGDLPSDVLLNRELALSRLALVQREEKSARESGVVLSSDVSERIEKARAAAASVAGSDPPDVAAAKYWQSLNASLWAGEIIAVQRARHVIARRGPRPGFKFGANAFGSLDHGESYTKHFYELFNYATLPFYYNWFERVRNRPDWERVDRMVEWCRAGNITPKGHPLLWMHRAAVPAWLEDRSFENVRLLHKHRIRRIVSRYKGVIDSWDVINEAHDLANILEFTYEQLFDLTRMCCDTARAANPACTSIINSTMVWGEYAAAGAGTPLPEVPKRTPYQYISDCIREKLDFDVIGLQLYFPHRDMLEIDRMLDRFGRFGKEVHITEHAIASDPSEDEKSYNKTTWGQWHAPFSETIQADWIEQLWTIAYSKEFLGAIIYWDFSDQGGHFWPHGGFLDAQGRPKEAYHRIKKLLDSWKSA